jgi:hypothetical protein
MENNKNAQLNNYKSSSNNLTNDNNNSNHNNKDNKIKDSIEINFPK